MTSEKIEFVKIIDREVGEGKYPYFITDWIPCCESDATHVRVAGEVRMIVPRDFREIMPGELKWRRIR